MMLVSLSAETIKLVFEGKKSDCAVERNASVYQVYALNRTTSEERAEFSKGWLGGGGGCGGGEISYGVFRSHGYND